MSIFNLLLIFLLPIFIILFLRERRGVSQKLPPGSLGIPFIGQSFSFLHALRKNTGEKWLQSRIQKYGAVSKLSLFGTPTVLLSGAAANKFIFTNDGVILANQQPQPIRRILGDKNLTELRGEDHRRVRGAIGMFLKPESLKKYVGKIDRVVRQHLDMNWKGHQTVKVYPMTKQLMFDVICSLLFDLEQGKDREMLIHDFHLLTQGLWSVPINLPFTRFSNGLKASRRIRRVVSELIHEKRSAMELGQSSPQDDFITCMLNIQHQSSPDQTRTMTEEEILDNAIVVMFAGHETSTSLLTFLLWFLAKDPVAYDAIVHEHEEIAKTKVSGELLNWDDLAKMKHTWKAAMETMRIIPPVFGGFRKVLKDFEYGGYLIPKGWQIISPYNLYLNPKLVVKQYEVWRLITNFLYFRKMDLDFLFHMFFLARYCKLLEENSFRGRTADFFYMLLFGATVLTGIVLIGGMIPYVSESFAKIIFLSNSLTFMMVYVWSKQNPFIHMSFLGLFTFTAAYLPWVLLGFSVLVGASAWVDLLGMIAGHAYYFLEDVYPRMTGRRPLRTPQFIKAMFADEAIVVPRNPNMRFAPPLAEGAHQD